MYSDSYTNKGLFLCLSKDYSLTLHGNILKQNKFRSMQETSIQYQFFPRYMGLIEPMAGVVGAFQKVEDKIASRNKYRTHNDFERIYAFLETMYISNRIKLPLKGILLIGY